MPCIRVLSNSTPDRTVVTACSRFSPNPPKQIKASDTSSAISMRPIVVGSFRQQKLR